MLKNKLSKDVNKYLSVLPKSFISKLISLLLVLLIFVVLLGFLGGIIKTFLDLQLLFHASVEEALRQLLLNVITLLAVVEIIKTVISYLTEGRVKVTYIVDTVLIVMLNEVISIWFKGPELDAVVILSIIILTLIVVRFIAIKFSPDID